MNETLLIICMCACVACAFLSMLSIVVSMFLMNRNITTLEKNFKDLVDASSREVSNLSEAAKDIASTTARAHEVLLLVSNAYTKHIDKLEENRDATLGELHEQLKMNGTLTTLASAPKVAINHNK